jgi:hypothetical protein
VEVDDAYVGGMHPGKVGCGAHGKVPFVIAVQTTTEESKPRYVRLDPVPGFTKNAPEWADRVLAPDALLVSDGLAGFPAAAELFADHERVVVGTSKNSNLGCFHSRNGS